MSGSLCLSADRLSDAGRERPDPSSHSPGVDPHETRTTREQVKKEASGHLADVPRRLIQPTRLRNQRSKHHLFAASSSIPDVPPVMTANLV
jgi:hypothetical protein